MARRIFEGAHSADFVAWEADVNYTRDNVSVPTDVFLPVSTPLLRIVAGGAIQPVVAANYAKLAATGTISEPVAPLAVFVGFLLDEVLEDEDEVETLRAVVKNGPAILREDRMVWPQGANDGATLTIRNAIKAAVPLIKFQ